MSALSSFNLQKCPLKTKLTVFGFIREVQLLFNDVTDNPYYNIPFGINCICLSFYYLHIGWDKQKCDKDLVISGLQDNIVTVAAENRAGATVYHINWHESECKGKVTFTIKLIKISDFFVGFSSFDDLIDDCFVNDERLNYGLQSDGDLWVEDISSHHSIIEENRMILELKKNDEVAMTLDLDQKEIYISHNKGDKIRLFENIETGPNIRYKFAVSFYWANYGDSVTITDIQDCTYE